MMKKKRKIHSIYLNNWVELFFYEDSLDIFYKDPNNGYKARKIATFNNKKCFDKFLDSISDKE